MSQTLKNAFIIFIALSLVFTPFTASFASTLKQEEETSAEAMIADFLIARPLGLVSLVIGTTMFVVSLPVSAVGGNTNVAAKKLVHEPAKFVFTRPLGEF
jgi:hypothetical protein